MRTWEPACSACSVRRLRSAVTSVPPMLYWGGPSRAGHEPASCCSVGLRAVYVRSCLEHWPYRPRCRGSGPNHQCSSRANPVIRSAAARVRSPDDGGSEAIQFLAIQSVWLDVLIVWRRRPSSRVDWRVWRAGLFRVAAHAGDWRARRARGRPQRRDGARRRARLEACRHWDRCWRDRCARRDADHQGLAL